MDEESLEQEYETLWRLADELNEQAKMIKSGRKIIEARLIEIEHLLPIDHRYRYPPLGSDGLPLRKLH